MPVSSKVKFGQSLSDLQPRHGMSPNKEKVLVVTSLKKGIKLCHTLPYQYLTLFEDSPPAMTPADSEVFSIEKGIPPISIEEDKGTFFNSIFRVKVEDAFLLGGLPPESVLAIDRKLLNFNEVTQSFSVLKPDGAGASRLGAAYLGVLDEDSPMFVLHSDSLASTIPIAAQGDTRVNVTFVAKAVSDKILAPYIKYVKDRQSLLKKNGIRDSDTLLGSAFSKFPLPSIEKTGFYVSEEVWSSLLYVNHSKSNCLLFGPTSSGKTELVELFAKVTGRPLRRIDMSGVVDPQTSLIGTHRMSVNRKNVPVSIFEEAPLAKAVRTKGCIILLDELNRAPQAATNMLLPLLDNRRYLPMSVASALGEEELNSDRAIPLAEDVLIFATVNIGIEYVGTNPIDPAIRSRFPLAIPLSYPDPWVESSILDTYTKGSLKGKFGSTDICFTIAELASRLREDALQGNLSYAPTVRDTKEIASLIDFGFTPTESVERILFSSYEAEELDTVKVTLKTLFP